MPQTITAFESLILPLTPEAFFSKYWGQDYFISKGDADRFISLFSWDALSEILSTHRFEFPRLRLLYGGRVLSPQKYIEQREDRRGNPYLVQNSAAVLRLLEDGAMLHITSIGEAWQPLAIFAAQLEPILCGKVQVNLHAGYAGSRGFHTHWDGHEVYAIQIDGSKKWRLFGFTEEAPLAVPPEAKRGAPSERVWEGVIGQGEMLYLPRGYWHATQFLDEPSLHLTLAVHHPTGLEFAHWLVDQLVDHSVIRRDIPAAAFAVQPTTKAKETYISSLTNMLSGALSLESLDRFLVDYRGTLGRVNLVKLSPIRKESPHDPR
jgi:ribosomal protein L16 Arg81 hydroxylase